MIEQIQPVCLQRWSYELFYLNFLLVEIYFCNIKTLTFHFIHKSIFGLGRTTMTHNWRFALCFVI